jgi:polyferredoxin
MTTLEELENEIEKIKERNARVEKDKAWETSWARRLLILILTYFVVVVFFCVADLPKPFANSIVPTLGFFLSTLTIPWVKARWMKNTQARSHVT